MNNRQKIEELKKEIALLEKQEFQNIKNHILEIYNNTEIPFYGEHTEGTYKISNNALTALIDNNDFEYLSNCFIKVSDLCEKMEEGLIKTKFILWKGGDPNCGADW